MSLIKFTKMQGLGNDYIYVDSSSYNIANPSRCSQFVSDRHFGIGGDGLVLIEPSAQADFAMRIFNADGSEAEMCGNAIRCLGKYVYERQLTKKTTLTVATKGGLKVLELTVQDHKVKSVRVDMGEPVLRPELVPTTLTGERIVNELLTIGQQQLRVSCVSMGNPHAVFFVPEITDEMVLGLGPKIEHHAAFPKRTNVEFVKVISRSQLEMRVWERGSGETLACGTGACAVLVAAVLNGHADRKAEIKLRGGSLQIAWEANNHVFKEGPAVSVFDGEIFIPD